MISLIIIIITQTVLGSIMTQSSTELNQQTLFSSVCQSGIREDNTNYIYCARRSLQQVPLFSKNNVVYDELVLSDNKISELSGTSFSRIKVKKIFLNGNPIRRIDMQAFSKLENHLEELWLDADGASLQDSNIDMDTSDSSNGIIGLPKAIINYLRNLNTLKLKGFIVKMLENGVFKRLNRIEILSLQFCSIENIEKQAFDGLKNSLKELYLDGNQLQYIPSDALLSAAFKSLKILSISQNNIKIISSDNFGNSDLSALSMGSLIKLDLSYNGLKQIDSQAFNSFNQSLEVLYLQNNEINSYNLKFLRQLNQMKELNLDFNLITKLNTNLFINSNKLQFLSLQGNSIMFGDNEQVESSSEQSSDYSAIPNEAVFEGLIGLQRLNMARNGIKHLPDGIFKPMKQLKNLILDKNQIDNLNILTFNGLEKSLMNISLQNTKIKSVHMVSLKNLERLERVKLGFNELDTLDWHVFTKMSSTLTNLDMQNNKIDTIIFDSDNNTQIMDSLLELDLSNNKLCSFDSNLIKVMPKLKNLGLSQNPLYCDCTLLPLYEWTVKKFEKDILSFIQWQCEGKNAVRRRFTSLTASEFTCSNTSKCERGKIVTIQPATTSTQSASVRINNVQLSSVQNSILVNWQLDASDPSILQDIRGFKISYNLISNSSIAPVSSSIPTSAQSSFLADKNQRKFKIDNLNYSSKYTVCVSIIRFQGYDKYCRDVDTDIDNTKTTKKQIKLNAVSSLSVSAQSSAASQQLTTSSSSKILSSSSSAEINTSNIYLSGIMITLLVILICCIIGLIIFIYIYLRKCKLSQKKLTRSKSLMNTTGHHYTGAILATSTINHHHHGEQLNVDPIDYQHTNQRVLNCVGVITSNGQYYKTNESICNCSRLAGANNTLGRPILGGIGDTSTVSSTLSSVNNAKQEQNEQINTTTNSWRFNPVNTMKPAHLHHLVMAAAPNIDHLNTSTSPNSFAHFIIQPGMNHQQQQQQHTQQEIYIPYELYNCFNASTNPTHTTALVVQPTFNNSNNIKTPTNNDHVYCEIPSTITRTYRNNQMTFNPQKNSFNLANMTNLQQISSSNEEQINHTSNGQNSSSSLLLSSSSASSTASSSLSPQSEFMNNKFNTASII